MLLKRLAQPLFLSYKPFQPFCFFTTSNTLRFDDVVKLHENPRGGYRLKFSGKKLTLDPKLSILHFKQKAKHKYKHIKIMRFFNEDLSEFADATPASFLLKENFLIQINNAWFNVITELESPVFQFNKDHNAKYDHIYKLYEDIGHSRRQAAILGKFAASLIEDLSDHAHNNLDSHIVKAVVHKNLYELSLEAKLKITRLDIKLEALRRKLEYLQGLKDEVDKKLEMKAKRRIKYMGFFVIAQVLALQYATYVAASWDVVEPIANLLGILELITAYSYWLWTNKTFSYHHIQQQYIKEREIKKYRKNRLDIQEYHDTKELIQLFENEKLFLSPKVEDLVIPLKYASEVPGESDDENEDLPLPLN